MIPRTSLMQLSVLLLLGAYVWLAAGVRSRLHRSPTIAAKRITPSASPSLKSLFPVTQNRVDWPEYLVEFRGIKSEFRFGELLDNIQYVLQTRQQQYTYGDISATLADIASSFETVIMDKERSSMAILGMLSVPNGDILVDAVNRCSTVRSLIQVWGKGETTEAANSDALCKLHTTIRHSFPLPSSESGGTSDTSGSDDKNSWRMNFRKYGRSKGFTNSEKVIVLRKFNTILQSLGGEVDLSNAQHDLIYIEQSPCIIGEILAEPKAIENSFNIKQRPFLGTTTMAAVSAHLTASAAMVGHSSVVLDPFCGTGSLLLNCAFLGAAVLGSDYDHECLGLPRKSKDRILKNVNFYRPGYDQSDKSTYDNFMYYQLQDRLMALLGCDAKRWLELGAYQMRHIQHKDEDSIVDDIIPVRLYSQSAERETFDTDIVRHNFLSAIVTDPPYGRREKAQETRGLLEESDALAFATSKHMGDPREITSLLFMMARRLVRKGGRLVFWYPTEANVEGEVIIRELEEIETRSRQEQDKYELRLVRVTADKLHDKMWRWLVVYEVRERERG